MAHEAHSHTPKGGFLFKFILFIFTFILLVSYVVGLNADSLPVQ